MGVSLTGEQVAALTHDIVWMEQHGALAASAGSAVGAGAGSTMAAATVATATTSATAAGLGNMMATAALTSMASTGAVSFINNKGNLGTALKDTFGSDSLKNATIGALTAGALNYADSTWFQGASPANGNGAKVITGGPVQNPGYSSEWLSWQKAQDAVVRSGTHAVIESGISTAINGGSLKDNLGSALVSQGFDLATAVGNKNLGDFADYMEMSPGSAEKIFLHAMLGGALSAARGGDFKTGAIAGGAAEGLTGVATDNLGKYLDTRFVTDDQFRVATAQIVGIAAGSLVNGDPNDAAWVAGNVERYNAQLHKPQTTALEKLRTLNPELSDRLNDAACALSQCAASIPVDDPRYGNFKARQDRGEGYKTEIEMLQATGEFEGRSWTDRSDDFLNAHGNVVQAADASVDTASGIVGGVGSYAGMMAMSPVCVGVLTCALPAGLGVLGTQQLVGAWDSASQINAGFISDQPGRVEAAFHLETFPGESSITKDLAASAGQSLLEMSEFGLAGKYFNGLSAADEVVFPRGDTVGPKGGALVTKGSDVTPEIIQQSLKGDKTISAQDGVSLPMIQRYVDRLLKGDVAPPIKMDGNVIVDGNHRYIAAKILGRESAVDPGVLTSYKASKKRPTVNLEISPLDWDNR